MKPNLAGEDRRKTTPELMADFYPPNSSRDHPPASDAGGPSANLPLQNLPLNILKKARQWLPHSGRFLCHSCDYNEDACEACLPGSNDWVVSGAHTVTGKPLLSNDMHLGHREPGIWYEVHLHAADFNVEGFTLPGLPFVIVGHNQRIAWGYTNLNPDVQDLFMENFNAAGEYQTPTGWQKPEIYHQVIRVKGEPDVPFDVKVTRHGPIITQLLPGETREIALEWMIYDPQAISVPLFDLDSAQDWDQFRKALSVFATPSQNVVYADMDGNIGYQPMGFVPIRDSGDGTVPVNGADGQHDWTGYLAFDKLPAVTIRLAESSPRLIPKSRQQAIRISSPPSGFRLIAWNESTNCRSPARNFHRRTCWPCKPTSPLNTIVSSPTTSATPLITAQSTTDRTSPSRRSILRGFDGRMLADSVAPTIAVRARLALWEGCWNPNWVMTWRITHGRKPPWRWKAIVQNQPARWLPPGYDNFDDMMTDAVNKALKDAPADLNTWKYGEVYPLVIDHPVFGAVPGLRGMSGPGRHRQSGGGYTVKQVGRDFGPSERMTVDFSNLDASTFNIVIGESGQIFSPYYMDHWPAWYGNRRSRWLTQTQPYSPPRRMN